MTITIPPNLPPTDNQRQGWRFHVVRFLPTILMLGFGVMLPLWHRLWEWAAGGCR